MTYDNTNKGTIAKNNRKEADNHPDIAGQINVAGVDYWINGWLKTNSQDGTKFYSLSVKPKVARTEAPAPPAAQSYGDKSRRNIRPPDREPVPAFVVAGDDPSDDIPF
jgi:hypothetical protein